MNRKKLCQIVDKYEDRLMDGGLTEARLSPADPFRVCIIGACLAEAGVEFDRIFYRRVSEPEILWNDFRDELMSQGVESPGEVRELISANDERDYYGDGTRASIPESLRRLLECK